MNKIKIKKTVSWLLFVAVALQIMTGYGITQYHTVENLTLGIITKPLAFQIHSWLPPTIIILLLAHVILNTETYLLKIKKLISLER